MKTRGEGEGSRVGNPRVEADGSKAMPGDETAMSRRRALQVLGAVPIAGALGVGVTGAALHQPSTPHPAPLQPTKRQFFTAREWRTAGVLADDIIPRDERSGSATEAGVLAYIDFHMSVPETNDDARVAMRGGLRWIDTESKRRFGVSYDKAGETQRHAILDDISGPANQAPAGLRAGATFFSSFRNQVGAGFFSSEMGWKDLRYLGNVFNPNWNGCPQPALDKLGVSYDLMQTRIPTER